jgi:hypothetical protein
MFATFRIVFAELKKDLTLGTDEITTAVSDDASMLIYLIGCNAFPVLIRAISTNAIDFPV